MGNSWTSDKRDYSKNWSPHSDDFERSGKRNSKRWSARKPRDYYKTVSDFDMERGLPLHFRYQEPNSVDEELFSMDARSPCVIHLHQRAMQDFNHLLRGSKASAGQPRPKSLDPKLLMESFSGEEIDPCSPQSPRNTSFLSTPGQVNHKAKQEHDRSLHSTSDQKMKIDSSPSSVDIIEVDTSGAKFERQANLRRSQRLSSCASLRQRNNASQRRQMRHKHKTLIGLPGNISSDIPDGEFSGRYSVHSGVNGSSYVEELSEESRSANSQVIVSPRPNLRSVEIQTDDVRVIPLTPSHKRTRQKEIERLHAIRSSKYGSNEFLRPTAVPCPKPPTMKHASAPANGVHEKDVLHPSLINTETNDTSTDEGRHTGESGPPTPVRVGTPPPAESRLGSTSLARKSIHVNGIHGNGIHGNGIHDNDIQSNSNNGDEIPRDIAMRVNSGRIYPGEDRASSGFWSGTESIQHSSSSDITTQHAPVLSALQHISPIVHSRPLVCSSTVSSSSVSINSKLSHLDINASDSSLYGDDDESFQSANSSVISVTLNRANASSSTLSLNSALSDGGNAMTAAAMLQKSRKSRLNGTGGAYNFMNYDADLPNTGLDEVSRAAKNRRSPRSAKHRAPKKRDTNSMPRATEIVEKLLVHSVGRPTNESDGSRFCEAHAGENDTPLPAQVKNGVMAAQSGPAVVQRGASACGEDHEIPKTEASRRSFVSFSTSAAHNQILSVKPSFIFDNKEPKISSGNLKNNRSTCYNSYNRAVNSNHSTPKSLLSCEKTEFGESSKHNKPLELDFNSELKQKLSVQRNNDKLKKEKRCVPPTPPKRASSLSCSSSPLPSSKSFSKKDSFSKTLITRNSVSSPPSTPSVFSEETSISTEMYKQNAAPLSLPPPPTEMLSSAASQETKRRPPAPPKPIRLSSTKNLKTRNPAKSTTSPKPSVNASLNYGIVAQSPQLEDSASQKNDKSVEHQELKSESKNMEEVKISAKIQTHKTELTHQPQRSDSPKLSDTLPLSTINNSLPIADKITISSSLAKPAPAVTELILSHNESTNILFPKVEPASATSAETDILSTTEMDSEPPNVEKISQNDEVASESTLATDITSETVSVSSVASNIQPPSDKVGEVSSPQAAEILLQTPEPSQQSSNLPTAAKTTPTLSSGDEISPQIVDIASVSPPAKVLSLNEKTHKMRADFAAKRARERSLSYKTSMARAAFFANVSSPPPVAPKPIDVQPASSREEKESSMATENIKKPEEIILESAKIKDCVPPIVELKSAKPSLATSISESVTSPVEKKVRKGPENAEDSEENRARDYKVKKNDRKPTIAPKPSMQTSITPPTETEVENPKVYSSEERNENLEEDLRETSVKNKQSLKDLKENVEMPLIVASATSSTSSTTLIADNKAMPESIRNEANLDEDEGIVDENALQTANKSTQHIKNSKEDVQNGENRPVNRKIVKISKENATIAEENALEADKISTERSVDLLSAKTSQKQETSPVETRERLSLQHLRNGILAKKPMNATEMTDRSRSKSPEKPQQPEYFTFADTSSDNHWMEQIQEFSGPNPSPKHSPSEFKSPRDSAASRLGLSIASPTSKYSTHENLMTAIHRSKRETLSSKRLKSSPPVSPGTNNEVFTYKANENKSPGSTLERKRNGRLSSNGMIRNGISRRSSGGTSRNDFKALLLQNACRGSSGSQMTAAEKLQLHKPTGASSSALSKRRPLSMNDVDKKVKLEKQWHQPTESSSACEMLSLADIHSAISSGSATTSRLGRAGRRRQMSCGLELGPKYATLSVNRKKHPPPSLSSKYNIRSRTPTRPMMSISEDIETERSPEHASFRPGLDEK